MLLLARTCGVAGKLGYLESGKAKVMVVDTFHLFDDTMPFLAELEEKYKFKAEIFQVMALLYTKIGYVCNRSKYRRAACTLRASTLLRAVEVRVRVPSPGVSWLWARAALASKPGISSLTRSNSNSCVSGARCWLLLLL